jgi:hypothetical protein
MGQAETADNLKDASQTQEICSGPEASARKKRAGAFRLSSCSAPAGVADSVKQALRKQVLAGFDRAAEGSDYPDAKTPGAEGRSVFVA